MNIFIIILILLSVLAAMAWMRGRKAKRYVASVEKEQCTGCGRCISQCKHQVLAMEPTEQDEGGKARRAVVRNPERCSACGHCVDACRFQALRLVERKR